MLSSYKIKLLNGAMRNRELQLPMGNLTLGTEDNDIVYFPLNKASISFYLIYVRKVFSFYLRLNFGLMGNPRPMKQINHYLSERLLI